MLLCDKQKKQAVKFCFIAIYLFIRLEQIQIDVRDTIYLLKVH